MFDQLRGGIFSTNVQRDTAPADTGREGFKVVFGRWHVQQDDVGAVPGQGFRDGCANAAGRAGDQRLATGLLDGYGATTHWRYTAELAQRFPAIAVDPDVLYVDSGQLITSAGSAAGIDLCLHLIRRDLGPRMANQVARRLVMPPHREGGQAQYIEEPVSRRASASLAPLLDAIRANLGGDWTIIKMAAHTASSARSFQRHFVNSMGMPPGEWLLMQRLAAAKTLLEETEAGVEAIAVQVGFGEAATLRSHFRRRLGTSPGGYRKRFRI